MRARFAVVHLLFVLVTTILSFPALADFYDPPSAPATSTGAYTISWDNAAYGLIERHNSGNWTVAQNMGVSTSKSFSGKAGGSWSYMKFLVIPYPMYTTIYSDIATVSVTAPPATPTNFTVPSSSSTGSFTVSWDTMGGATSYTLQRQTNGGGWSAIQSSSATSRNESSLVNNSYGYKVRSCNSAGCSGYTATKTITVANPYAPPVVPSSSSTGNYTVNWVGDWGLQEKKDSGNWVVAQNQFISSSKSFSGKAGGTYHYRSWLYIDYPVYVTVYSEESQIVVTTPPTVPTDLTAPGLDGDGAFTVSWTGSAAATSYTVQRQVNGGGWSTLYSGSATSISQSGLGNGNYSYRVKACGSGCSGYSSAVSTTVLFPPATPTGLSAPAGVSSNSVLVSWNSAANASSYVLERQTVVSYPGPPYFDIVWQQVYNGSSTSFTDTSLPYEGSFPYRVKAINATDDSNYSSQVSVLYDTVPDAPGGLTIPAQVFVGESFSVLWNTAAGVVTYYQLEHDGPNASPSVVYSGGATNYSATELEYGDSQYRVRACNAHNCGPWSSSTSVEVDELFNLAGEPSEITSYLSPGSLDYTTEVTPAGNATISVPLVTPPGVNGLQPSLALGYSSGSGGRKNDQGLPQDTLGYGWSLSGVSAIQTCKAGTANGAIQNPTDLLCLDGEPLIPVSGSQFSTNTVYRTKKESFVRVTQKNNGNNAWFEVQYPDGRVAQYGNTADSYVATRYVVPTYSITQWSVNKVTDAFGNQMSYTYNQTYGTDGSHYPLSITYDNTTISFYYTWRDDISSSLPLALLHTIEMHVGGTLVRDYRLLSENGTRRRLQKVQQCGYTESGYLDTCLSPLEFTWTDPATSTNDFKTGVSQITDGLGATTQFDYALLSAAGSKFTEKPFGNYIAPANATALTTDKYVAVAMHRANGVGGEHTTRYAYSDAGFNSSLNWGFLGFYAQRITDEQSHIVTYLQRRLDNEIVYGEIAAVYQYHNAYPSYTEVLSKLENQHAQITINHGTGNNTYYVYNNRRTQFIYESNQLLGAIETTTTPTVSNGLITAVTVSTRTADTVTSPSFTPGYWGHWPMHSLSAIEHTLVETTTFNNRTSGTWLIGFPSSIDKIDYKGAPGGGVEQVAQQAVFTPHASSLKILSATRFPGDPYLELTTTYAHDSYGNVTSTTVSGAGVASRTSSASNFLHKRYPQTLVNAKNHTTTIDSYDLRFGSAKQLTDPNYRVVSEVRNGLGRITSTTDADGVTTTITYEACVPGGCGSISGVEPVYRIATSSPIKPTRFEYFDQLGRRIRLEVESFTGLTVRKDIVYDNQGRVEKTSQPYFAGDTPQYVIQGYDLRNRVIGESRPDGGATGTNYSATAANDGILVSVTETVKQADGTLSDTQEKRSEYNLLAQLVNTTDAYGSATPSSVVYTYNPAGLMASASVEAVATSTFGYDAAGNRTTMTGPNTGTVTTTYTALGEVNTTTDNSGQTTTYHYDVLGRTTSRTDDDGTATWEWDTAANGIGLLHSRGNAGFSETYTYNSASRVSNIHTAISVSGYPNLQYDTDYTYDGYGRLQVIDYPSGLAVKQEYNSRGYLATLRNNSTNAVLQTFSDTDAFGQITQESYGNGVNTSHTFDSASGRLTDIDTTKGSSVIQNLYYTWRSNGTLESRTHQPTGYNSGTFNETMTYDSLNRLKNASTLWDNVFEGDLRYNYDALGNLLNNDSTQAVDTDAYWYQYGTTPNAGPHAVSEVTVAGLWSGGIVNYTLHYNLNGALEHYEADTGPDKFIRYNAANQPTVIVVGASLADPNPSAKDEFKYDPDGARFYKKSTYQEDGVTKITHTIYVDDYENIFIENDPNVIETRKTQVGDAMLHIDSIDPLQVLDSHVEYLHRDHLGSVDTVTDEGGNILQVTPFKPFGTRKHSNWRHDIDPAEGDQLLHDLNIRTAEGFTGHEHLDRTGFIHMGGRLYDPTIGRFLSPDPFVQEPTNSQSWNRYSYALNSPLSYTDPTGYQFTPIPISTTENNTSYSVTSVVDIQWGYYAMVTPTFSFGFGGGGLDGGGGFGMSYSITYIAIPIPILSTEVILKPEYTTHAGLADNGRPDVGYFDWFGENEQQLVIDIANGVLEEFVLSPARDVAEGRIVSAACNIAKLCRAGQKLYNKVLKRAVDRVLKRVGCSFIAGTLIATPSGAVPIEEIEPGDRVLARDDQTGQVDSKPVKAVFAEQHDSLIYLTVKGDGGQEVIITTAEHPFYVEGVGWAPAGNLQDSNDIQDIDGERLDIVSISKVERFEVAYNFEVADYHTYAVGDNQAWVHNECDLTNAAKEIPISRAKYGEAADHIADAQKAGHPDVLTIARDGASANRDAAIGGLSKVPSKQLDEYPPAMFKEGGAGASVRAINPKDNLGAGACIGNACRGLANGEKVRIKVVD